MERSVHFILGESAAGSLRQALPGASIVCMADWFSHGRCRFDDGGDVRAWLADRHRWWLEECGDDSPEAYASGPDRIAQFEDAIDGIEEAIIWLADGTTERLHACWLAAVLPESVRARVAVPANTWTNTRVQTIGIVRSETLAATSATDVDADRWAELAELWRAFVEPTPEQEGDSVVRGQDVRR